MGVPAHFIAVALDEGPGPPLRSPYADLTKLYSVVGILVRCCDVSAVQRTCKEVRNRGLTSEKRGLISQAVEGVRYWWKRKVWASVCCAFYLFAFSLSLSPVGKERRPPPESLLRSGAQLQAAQRLAALALREIQV